MPFPTFWPPPRSSTFSSFRFFKTGTTTANFADNAWLFGSEPGAVTGLRGLPVVRPGDTSPVHLDQAPAAGVQTSSGLMGGGANDGQHGNPVPLVLCARFIQLFADTSGGIIEFSFDGTNVHGELKEADMPNLGMLQLEDRHESGIALRTKSGATHCVFRLSAW